MSASKFIYLTIFLVIIGLNDTFGAYPIPASVTMEAAKSCSGSANLITFRAGGYCPAYPVQWDVAASGFIINSTGPDWIKGYFMSGGIKTIFQILA